VHRDEGVEVPIEFALNGMREVVEFGAVRFEIVKLRLDTGRVLV